MRLVTFVLILVLSSCSQQYEISLFKKLENFSCPKLDNCLSSNNKGENYLLPIKMMGEDEAQNISNISKVVAQFEELKVQKNQGPYLYLKKDDLHIEFVANKELRSVLIRTQKQATSILSSDLGKKLIEAIRFKLYQNDY